MKTHITFAEYQRLEAVNHSALCKLNESPTRAFYAVYGQPQESKALSVGSAFHTLLLEPASFSAAYAVADQRTKAGKEAATEALEAGKSLLTNSEWDQVHFMVEGVRLNPIAWNLIQESQKETSFQWNDEKTGLDLKAREDLYSHLTKFQVDIKTVRSARGWEFSKAVHNYHYDSQLAFYRRARLAHGDEVNYSLIIAVEKEPPFVTECYLLSEQEIRKGDEKVSLWLTQWAELKLTGNWFGLRQLQQLGDEINGKYNTTTTATDINADDLENLW